ncbi:MAG: hypothetical protein K2M55_02305 [Muribaculaceae bacterium]|nr:hypothetical protein [Muribaculaceae bacterium]
MRAAILIALVSILLTCTPLSAQKNERSSERQRVMAELKPYKKKFLVKELELTKEQTAEFMPLYDEMTDKVQSVADETRKLERSVLKKDNASDIELEAAARAQFEQKEKEAKIELAYYEKFRDILSPKQLLRLKAAERKFNQHLVREHQKIAGERKGKDGRK